MRSLEVKQLNLSFPDKELFRNASLRIEMGSITGILGPNGSGKTTLFDILCKVKSSQQWKINSTFRTQLYLSQIITTPPVLRMHDIFTMATVLSSDRKPTQQCALNKIEKWCPELTERYKEIWKKKSAICSYGEKRWFFTLSLLALEPELLILDEPTAGIDPEFRHYTWQCLKQAAQEGAAIVVSSHNIEEVTAHCDVFYMISGCQFIKFHSGEEFTSAFTANSLDEAFIRAAVIKTPVAT
ncbi:ATP-binding cassette domain-containing protein [Pseudomonas sp. Z2-11]